MTVFAASNFFLHFNTNSVRRPKQVPCRTPSFFIRYFGNKLCTIEFLGFDRCTFNRDHAFYDLYWYSQQHIGLDT